MTSTTLSGHVLPIFWAGGKKALSLSIEAEALNPFVTVISHDLYVGGAPDQSNLLDQLLVAADVVVDATGSQKAARILQRRCREFGKPLVLASLTSGSYGAEVAPLRAQGTLLLLLCPRSGGWRRPVRLRARATTRPQSAAARRLLGAGFDATALAALAARTTIRGSGMCGCPALDYDFVIVNFRGEDPWRQGILSTHPGCPLCS